MGLGVADPPRGPDHRDGRPADRRVTRLRSLHRVTGVGPERHLPRPGAKQLAFDPTGRHLRHPDVFGKRLVATAYAYDGGDPDDSIQRPGSIALFDTTTARPIRDLTSAATDGSPVFSPDGRRVAFERRGSVFAVPVSGGRARVLLRRAREPSWSR